MEDASFRREKAQFILNISVVLLGFLVVAVSSSDSRFVVFSSDGDLIDSISFHYLFLCSFSFLVVSSLSSLVVYMDDPCLRFFRYTLEIDLVYLLGLSYACLATGLFLIWSLVYFSAFGVTSGAFSYLFALVLVSLVFFSGKLKFVRR